MVVVYEERELMKLKYVGIDVSAKTFTTIIDHEGERTEAIDLPNDPKGFKKLIRLATKKGFSAQVVLEATGNYSLDLALANGSAPNLRGSPPRAVREDHG